MSSEFSNFIYLYQQDIQPLFAQLTAQETPGIFNLNLADLGATLMQVGLAIIVLIFGWIIAAILAKITQLFLKKFQLDNRLSQILGSGISITALLSTLIFWVIFLIAVVASLDALRLTTASQPLSAFLNQVFIFLPKLGAAIILGLIAWAVATLAKMVAVQSARSLNLDRPLQPTSPEGGGEADTPAILVSDMLGNSLYWFVLLFFLPLILGVLELQGSLQPVQNLLNDLLGALPFILKAGIIAVVGWLIARIVRGIAINLMTAAGVQRLGQRLSPEQASLGDSLVTIAGGTIYVLILIPTAIAAFDALQIQAISQPATAMLNLVLTALPRIFMAGVIVLLSYGIGRFVADIVQNFLHTIGFDQVLSWLGIETSQAGETASHEANAARPYQQPPSQVVGMITLVGIMLLGTIAAVEVLNISALTAFVSALVVVLGRVLVGILVLAVGLYFANLAFRILSSTGTAQSRLVAQAVRLALLTFVGAIALQQMGIAPSLVNLAFGLLFGSIAVAIALAFGLGCRSIAAAQVQEWLDIFKGKR